MALSSGYQFSSVTNKSPRFAPKTANDTPTQIRLRLCLPKFYQQESVISQLISAYGITVLITAMKLNPNAENSGWFDLKMKGTPEQLQAGLAYLQALNVKIIGKANPGYDGWHC